MNSFDLSSFLWWIPLIFQISFDLSSIHCSIQHIPSGYPMCALLPLLARLLQLIEPLSSTNHTTSTTHHPQLALGTCVSQGGQNLFSGSRSLEGSYEQSDSVMTPLMKKQLCEVLLCLERANKWVLSVSLCDSMFWQLASGERLLLQPCIY